MQRVVSGVVVLLLVVSLVATPVAAQETQRVGGTIVIDEGETVNGFRAIADRVVIRGTVTGNLEVYGGSVYIAETGEVTGRLRAYVGDAEIDGRVGENVLIYGGNARLTETGEVGGSFGVFAGAATVAGTIGNNANLVAGTTNFEASADVGGSVYYEGGFNDGGGRVDGPIRQASDLELAPDVTVPPALVVLYALFANLLLGVILLRGFPDSSSRIADRIVGSPLETVVSGLVVSIGGLVLTVLLFITVVGAPLGLVALGLWFVVAWVGTVYARIAIGALLLSATGIDTWWTPLVVGVVLIGVLVQLPVIGEAVFGIVTLFGMGGIGLGAYDWYASAQSGN